MTTSTVSIGVEFFLPTDAKHWIPNGFQVVDLQIDSETADDANDDDWWDALTCAAEAWCEQTHGIGSFSQIIAEP